MIEQVSNAITFLAFYTASGEGKTGLTVTIDVYRGTTEVVTAGSATEIGDGLYYYTLASGSVTTEALYTAVFKTTDVTVDQKHLPALWAVGTAGIENLDAAIGDVPTAAAIADAVLDEDVTAHSTILSLGYYIASIQGSFTAVTNSLSVLGARLGSWTGTGVNNVLGAFKALLSKAASAPSDIGGTFDPAADSTEAIAEAVAAIDSGGATAEEVRIEMDANSTQLAAIKAKTDLITDDVTYSGPVASSGNVTLYQGKDYADADGTALTWSSTSTLTLSTAAVTFDVNGEQFAADVTGSSGAWTIKVDLTAAETAALPPGSIPFEVVAVLSGGRTPPPLITGTCTVRAER